MCSNFNELCDYFEFKLENKIQKVDFEQVQKNNF